MKLKVTTSRLFFGVETKETDNRDKSTAAATEISCPCGICHGKRCSGVLRWFLVVSGSLDDATTL